MRQKMAEKYLDTLDDHRGCGQSWSGWRERIRWARGAAAKNCSVGRVAISFVATRVPPCSTMAWLLTDDRLGGDHCDNGQRRSKKKTPIKSNSTNQNRGTTGAAPSNC